MHRYTNRGWLKGIDCTKADNLNRMDEYTPWDFYMKPRWRDDTYNYNVNITYDGYTTTTAVGKRRLSTGPSDDGVLRFKPIVFQRPGKYKACFCSSLTTAELGHDADKSVTPLGACSFVEDFDYEFGVITADPISCLEPGI